jgi:DNA-binding winged helix-turn-helix (wHTH) protein
MRLSFGDCELDLDTRQLYAGGKEVHLQPKAFQVLELLLQNRPRAVSKDEIHEKLWPGTFVSDGTLTSLIAEVRDAIGDPAHEPRFVRTLHRFGYAFSGAAEETSGRLPDRPGLPMPAYCLIRGRRRVSLEAGESIIGRDPGATAFIDHPSVSRRHARIVVSASGAVLEDLGSKNGTFLDDTRIERPVPLADGHKLRVGSVDLILRVFPFADSTQTAVKERN